MLGVAACCGRMSHLDLLPAGFFSFSSPPSSLFLFCPAPVLVPAGLPPLFASLSSNSSPSPGAGTTGGAPHWVPWAVAPGIVAARREACLSTSASSSPSTDVMCLARARILSSSSVSVLVGVVDLETTATSPPKTTFVRAGVRCVFVWLLIVCSLPVGPVPQWSHAQSHKLFFPGLFFSLLIPSSWSPWSPCLLHSGRPHG